MPDYKLTILYNRNKTKSTKNMNVMSCNSYDKSSMLSSQHLLFAFRAGYFSESDRAIGSGNKFQVPLFFK